MPVTVTPVILVKPAASPVIAAPEIRVVNTPDAKLAVVPVTVVPVTLVKLAVPPVTLVNPAVPPVSDVNCPDVPVTVIPLIVPDTPRPEPK